MINIPTASTKQRGIALAVSLILLLMITILGISALNSSRLQTYIARNMHLKAQSFQNTESGLLIGEQQWVALVDACLETPATCSEASEPQLPLPQSPAGIPGIDSIVWDDLDDVAIGANAKVYIEKLGEYQVILTDRILSVYRVTARGQDFNTLTNNSTNTETTLQTLVRTCAVVDSVTDQSSPC